MTTCVQREDGKSWSIFDERGQELAFVALSAGKHVTVVVHKPKVRLRLFHDQARSLSEALKVAVIATENQT